MQNSLEELFALVRFHSPGTLGSSDMFSRLYIDPIKNGQRKEASKYQVALMKKAAKKLAKELSPIILRRTKEAIANEVVKISLYLFFLTVFSCLGRKIIFVSVN